MIRVLAWAKSNITRTGLEAIVQADARFEVVRSLSRSPDLVSSVRTAAPDVVLLDMKETSIVSRLHGLWDQSAPAAVAPALVVLIDSIRRADILRVLQSGARAILGREVHPGEITAALQAARDGLLVFSPEILELLVPISTELAGTDDLPPGEPLTSREIEVLALLAEGAGNKEIAARLQISEHTAKFHVSSILSKLGAATRTEAVTRGYREGLILM